MFGIKQAQQALIALEPNSGSPAAHGLAMAAEHLGETEVMVVGGAAYVRLEEVVHVVARVAQVPAEMATQVVVEVKLGQRSDDPPPDPG